MSEKIDEIKGEINGLTAEEQLEIAEFSKKIGIENKKQQEIKHLIQFLPKPVTKNDKLFIENNRNKLIQWDKITLQKECIIIDGISWPRELASYEDLKHHSGIQLHKNVECHNGHTYFNVYALALLQKIYRIPNTYDFDKAAHVVGGRGNLGLLLNHPKTGSYLSNGKIKDEGILTELWLPSSSNTIESQIIVFSNEGGSHQADIYWPWNDKRIGHSLIFIKD